MAKSLRPRQFAEELGVTRRTVYNWVRQGKVKYRRVGTNISIPASELERQDPAPRRERKPPQKQKSSEPSPVSG